MSELAIQEQLGSENYCFGCGRENPDGLHLKSYWNGTEAVATFHARPAFAAGPRHVLNGGILATVIDCHAVCTAIADAYAVEGRAMGTAPVLWCATGSLTIEYLRPTPIDAELTLRAHVEARDDKRRTVVVTVEAAGKERARARVIAVMVPPSWRAG